VDISSELDSLLSELFSDSEDNIEINYTPGCVPVESEECLQEAIDDSERIKNILYVLDLEEKIDSLLDTFFQKRSIEDYSEILLEIISIKREEYKGQ
jgi:hypothetical protein